MTPPSSRSIIAGIDIGGTNVRCALAQIETPGQILVRRIAKTPADGGVEPVLSIIADGLERCLKEAGYGWEALAAVGCVVPGITDAARGVVIEVANLPGWQHIPLTSLLERRFGRPAVVENDVNAAALGEFAYGAGQGCHSLVYLTVSTGVAAGIVVEGRLLRGYHHAAGELGYFIPDPVHLGKNWEPSGCLELTSAGIGLAHAWADLRGGPATSDRAIEVFDTGVGISPDFLDKVFEPFLQEERAYSNTQRGTGLGLAITREIVERMGGQITVSSTLDQGTVFTVLLASAQKQQTQPKAVPDRSPKGPAPERHPLALRPHGDTVDTHKKPAHKLSQSHN